MSARGELVEPCGQGSDAKIQSISFDGILILIQGTEFFMSFTQFPWFLEATIEQICNFQFYHGKYLHWPDLDVDTSIDVLKNPSLYPLKYF